MGVGIYLQTPNKKKDTISGSSAKIKFAASSMQGWRNSMEDAHIAELSFDQNTSLFAVFDGHGGKTQIQLQYFLLGKDVSEFCASQFGQLLKKNSNYKKNEMKLALREVFEELDGCTGNVILIRDSNIYEQLYFDLDRLFLANTGDSRSILNFKTGEVEQLSIDHKPELDSEKKRISDAGGFIVNGRINGNLNLSRAIGDLEYKKDKEKTKAEQIITCVPEIFEKTIDQNFKYILMGCDGIFEILSNESLFQYIENEMRSTEGSLIITVENLLEQIIAPATNQGVGCDNMSAILIKFDYE